MNARAGSHRPNSGDGRLGDANDRCFRNHSTFHESFIFWDENRT